MASTSAVALFKGGVRGYTVDMRRALVLVLVMFVAALPAGADGGVADAGVDDGGALADGGADDGGIAVDDAGTEDDAGASAADAGACVPTCAEDVLTFCDEGTGAFVDLDCSVYGARCGELDEEWGMDCLLPEGAPCTRGYADGRSRCDKAAALFCTDGACSTTPPGPEEPPEIADGAGGIGSVSTANDHPLAFLGCNDSNTPDLPFLSLVVVLALRRRRT